MNWRPMPAAFLICSLALAGCLGEVLNLGPVSPYDYIRSDDFKRWEIEVDFTDGERPSSSVLSLTRSRLSEIVDKPGGIQFSVDDNLGKRGGSWTAAEILALRDDRMSSQTGGESVATYLVFLDGHWHEDTNNQKVFGVTIGHDVIAIFSETISDSCTLLNGCTDSRRIHEVVAIHEFGHAVGLVNRGIPMVKDHQDTTHGAHSDNRESVMFWAAETSNIFEILGQDLPDSFDQNDRADVCNAGGRC